MIDAEPSSVDDRGMAAAAALVPPPLWVLLFAQSVSHSVAGFKLFVVNRARVSSMGHRIGTLAADSGAAAAAASAAADDDGDGVDGDHSLTHPLVLFGWCSVDGLCLK